MAQLAGMSAHAYVHSQRHKLVKAMLQSRMDVAVLIRPS